MCLCACVRVYLSAFVSVTVCTCVAAPNSSSPPAPRLRSLLVLFLTDSLGYSDPQAVAIYSYFGSLAYVTPLIGGYLSDSYLGKYKVCVCVRREKREGTHALATLALRSPSSTYHTLFPAGALSFSLLCAHAFVCRRLCEGLGCLAWRVFLYVHAPFPHRPSLSSCAYTFVAWPPCQSRQSSPRCRPSSLASSSSPSALAVCVCLRVCLLMVDASNEP